MSPKRAIQIEMVQNDLQQALECMAADHWDLAIKHAEQGTQKIRDFKSAEVGTRSTASQTELTIDIESEKQ